MNAKEIIEMFKIEKPKPIIKIELNEKDFMLLFSHMGEYELAKRNKDFKMLYPKELIKDIYVWFKGEVGKFDNTKGFFIVGKYRTGKTILANIIIDILSANSVWVKKLNSFEVQKQGDSYLSENIYIDDLGKEPDMINNFGTKQNPMIQLLYERAEKMKFTIMTSNLKTEGLKAKYSEWIYNRIIENFNMIKLD